MKRYLVLIAFLGLTHDSFAQYETDQLPHHEIHLNIANLLIVASVEAGYEYFFDFNQSVGAEFLIDDRPNYHSESHGRKFKTNSLRLDYTYYFGNYSPGSGVYIQPFAKYRFGDFEEREKDYFGDYGEKKKTDMDAFMIGIGLGYKWNFSNSFVLGPYVNFARNFSDEVKTRFSAFDYNAGFNIGYRF